ncbi:peptide deformylase [Rhabdobacter roseus]|uniref:Peptide deformylase n=1 Tax=Rhabdobacter roseus TaxID=1655419 RepID=A0A840TUW5_9BACT|nr:peptide deformylase [Rhabdobacter roseus]MBB5286695.1 peptide deformylase [Rhabdobacter roseus]
MIYPIVAYGDPVLRKVTRPLEKDEMDLKKLADDMFETMYSASGVGLAAPQVGLNVRIFVVDGTPLNEGEEEEDIDPTVVDFKKVFINPQILHEEGDEWPFEEGCLSIPGIRGDVYRPERLRIRYRDLDWNEIEEAYEGMAARIIQHEYDHLQGKLFTDYLPTLKRQLLKKKLSDIAKGQVDVSYRMRFPSRR